MLYFVSICSDLISRTLLLIICCNNFSLWKDWADGGSQLLDAEKEKNEFYPNTENDYGYGTAKSNGQNYQDYNEEEYYDQDADVEDEWMFSDVSLSLKIVIRDIFQPQNVIHRCLKSDYLCSKSLCFDFDILYLHIYHWFTTIKDFILSTLKIEYISLLVVPIL